MRGVIFDLDGTLVDSAPDIHATVAKTLEAEGIAPLGFETVRGFIGNGVPKLIERVVGAVGLRGAEVETRFRTRFMSLYHADASGLTVPYPNVVPALEALAGQGYALAICTNKPEGPTRAVLDGLDLARFFAAVVGGDTLPVHKPDPRPLRHALAGLGCTAALYVGDSDVDAETAQRAALPFALFTEGYRKSPVEALPHDHRFSNFATLPELVAAHFNGNAQKK